MAQLGALIKSLLTVLYATFFGLYSLVYPKTPNPTTFNNFMHDVRLTQIAHRGGSADAPENTMCAFRNAVSHGIKTIEIDIQYTSDGVAIVIHDDTLDRTTTGTGVIEDTTLEEIKALSANKNFPDMGDCPVPTLDEVVQFAREHGVVLLLDVKGGGYTKKVSRTITELHLKYPDYRDRFAVISFFADILYTVRTEHPTVITGFTRRHDHIQVLSARAGYTGHYTQKFMWMFDRFFDFVMFYVFVPCMQINMLEIFKVDVSERYVSDVAPLPILAWTVDDPLEKKFFKHLGCAIMSNVVSDT